jgi:hypothetical protein
MSCETGEITYKGACAQKVALPAVHLLAAAPPRLPISRLQEARSRRPRQRLLLPTQSTYTVRLGAKHAKAPVKPATGPCDVADAEMRACPNRGAGALTVCATCRAWSFSCRKQHSMQVYTSHGVTHDGGLTKQLRTPVAPLTKQLVIVQPFPFPYPAMTRVVTMP